MRKFNPRDAEPTLVGRALVDQQPKLSAGMILANRLVLVRELGRGGMGVVWLAKDQDLDREVAVKLISAKISSESQYQERFRKEMKALAKCNHPNIVGIFGLFLWEGLIAFEMEYVPGQDVANLIENQGPCAATVVRQTADSIGDALTLIHNKGLIHRDVKPANILLGKNHRPVLMDFGLVLDEHANDRVTQSGMVLGTFGFMAPEQMNGRPPISEKVDQYSLAATLLAMLLGLNSLPLIVDWDSIQLQPYSVALQKALSIDPDRRYSSIAEFRSEFLSLDSIASEFKKGSSGEAPHCLDCGGTGSIQLANQSGVIPCNRCFRSDGSTEELDQLADQYSTPKPNLSNYSFNSFSGRLSIESSSVGDKEFAEIVKRIEPDKVRWLELSNKPITDATLFVIGNQLPNLETLSLDDCHRVTKQGLLMLEPLSKLQYIFVERCPEIELDACPTWLRQRLRR